MYMGGQEMRKVLERDSVTIRENQDKVTLPHRYYCTTTAFVPLLHVFWVSPGTLTLTLTLMELDCQWLLQLAQNEFGPKNC